MDAITSGLSDSQAPANESPTKQTQEDTRAARLPRARFAHSLGRAAAALPFIALGAGGAVLATRRQHGFGEDATGARVLGLVLIGTGIGLAFARWRLARGLTEHLAYEVEAADGSFEIRRYAPSIRAETIVEGAPWHEALNEGFRRLAGYIFGDNDRVARRRPHRSVRLERDTPAGRKALPMTTPVVVTVSGSDVGATMTTGRTVALVTPGDRTIHDLPIPNDSRVRLRAVPSERRAVLRFRGAYKGSLPARKQEELLLRVRAAGLTPIGHVIFAGYDPPTTLPFLRRNEVLVEVR